ncbi:MAG: prepilin-type N-terminal cleavage/methylation domain-containing protein [Vulcanimicrobiota bacterium]
MITRKKYKKNGFTLAELLVAVATFTLLMLTLTSSFLLGVRYMKKTEAASNAQITARNISFAIVSELRQACPNPAAGNTGYPSIYPSVDPTAILQPNANNHTSNYILFTEPDFSDYDPAAAGFNRFDPDIYQQVKYYVQDNVLYREVRKISGGNLQAPVTTPLAEPVNGTIQLQFNYITARTVEIIITVVENQGDETETSYTSSTHVSIMVN